MCKNQHGFFSLDFDSATTIAELWFENEFGRFKLAPYLREETTQLSFYFDNDFIIEHLAAEYQHIFYRSIEAIAVFATENQVVAAFCIRYGQ